MTYCNAGHNPPLLLQTHNGNTAKLLKRTALPLGILADTEWHQDAERLMPGDVLILYTDGVTEAEDEDESFFGEQRLRTILEANSGRSAAVIESKVIAAIEDFKGDAEQGDDITLMVVVRET
jgi:sigma-B regulation protein RsbU (phosphoserine phosphatase)